MKRITSMSKVRFEELRQGWLDGTLSAKWEGRKATTKSEQVEERQLRAMAAMAQGHPDELQQLIKKEWSFLEVLEDGELLRIRVW